MFPSYFKKCFDIQANNIKKITEDNIIKGSYIVKGMVSVLSRLKKESKIVFYSNVILKNHDFKIIKKTDNKVIISNKEKEMIFYQENDIFCIDVINIKKSNIIKCIKYTVFDYEIRDGKKAVTVNFESAFFNNGDSLGQDPKIIGENGSPFRIYKIKDNKFNFIYGHLAGSGFNCSWNDFFLKDFISMKDFKTGLRKVLCSIENAKISAESLCGGSTPRPKFYEVTDGRIRGISFVSNNGVHLNQKHKPRFYLLDSNGKLCDAAYSYSDDENKNIIPDFIKKHDIPIKKNYDWPKEYIKLAEMNNVFFEE